MELLDKQGNLKLFENENSILVDKSLPKYKALMNIKKVSVKDDFNEEVNIKYAEVNDPDSVTPDQLFFIDDERKKKVIEQFKDLKGLREIIGSEKADKYNIRISSRLLDLVKNFDSSSRLAGTLRFMGSSEEGSRIILNDNRKPSFKEKLEKNFRSFLSGISDNKEKKKEVDDNIYEFSVIDLFDNVKVISSREHEFKERLDAYMGLLQKAISMHQEAQIEKLISKLSVHIYESILAVSGYNHYITFENLINLQKKCKKQLDMDYVKNFVRIIPNEVVEKKILADELHVFDNYVILHYNPDGKSFELTEKEKEIKKDPILFGVINGSNKLYYIADWIDELCDLTWEQVVEKLGEDKTL